MCHRLLFGRRSGFDSMRQFREIVDIADVRNLVYGILRSEEFRNYWETVGMQLPEVPVMAEVNGLKIWFYLSDRIVGWTAAQGAYESDLAGAIRDFVQPGMVCCDLGANLGYFSLLMAQAGTKVYAFEPFQKCFDLLERNVLANGYADRIKFFRAAVMDKAGTSTLCVDHNQSDYVAMFVPTAPDSAAPFRQLSIETVVLDDVIPATEKVGCIKMDIEGAEPLALRGMSRILQRDRPRIFFEFNPLCIERHSGVKPEELLTTLRDHGYKITALDGQPWSYDGSLQVPNLVAHP